MRNDFGKYFIAKISSHEVGPYLSRSSKSSLIFYYIKQGQRYISATLSMELLRPCELWIRTKMKSDWKWYVLIIIFHSKNNMRMIKYYFRNVLLSFYVLRFVLLRMKILINYYWMKQIQLNKMVCLNIWNLQDQMEQLPLWPMATQYYWQKQWGEIWPITQKVSFT